MNKETIVKYSIAAIMIIAIGIAPIMGSFPLFYSASSQPVTGPNITGPLPVILVHGYFEDASIWLRWEQLLQSDGIQAFPVTFQQSSDECGSAKDHAQELSQIVQDVKRMTGQNQVNIVGHSKGGLDARVYLNNNIDSSDIVNLIMIGTPNAGSPLADLDVSDPCIPAINDIKTGAADTLAVRNPNTQYYTIAGDWTPFGMYDCLEDEGGYYYYFSHGLQPNDGIVPISSVESQSYFINLGHSPDCHQNLLGDMEYQSARDVLLGR
jgi:pimeloyl-ACP methyl ester carboxylesterase